MRNRSAKPASDQQQGGLAPVLEQRVGGERRAHSQVVDHARRDGLVRSQSEQVAYALERGVSVELGVVGEHLVDGEGAIGPQGDDVSKRAAAIDEEAPLPGPLRWRTCGLALGPAGGLAERVVPGVHNVPKIAACCARLRRPTCGCALRRAWAEHRVCPSLPRGRAAVSRRLTRFLVDAETTHVRMPAQRLGVGRGCRAGEARSSA